MTEKLSFLEWVLEVAREEFERSGEQLEAYIQTLHPQMGPSPPRPVPMHSQSAKPLVEQLLVALAQQGFSEICFVSEAYRCKYPKGMSHEAVMKDSREWIRAHGSLRGHPFAREHLMVDHYTERGDTPHFAAISATRALGKWESMEGAEEKSGRFSRIFKKARTIEGN